LPAGVPYPLVPAPAALVSESRPVRRDRAESVNAINEARRSAGHDPDQFSHQAASSREVLLSPMYCDHFNLRERPFTHAPGQRFFVANPGMADAIVRLQHVLTARDAIAVLSGGPGVGKTAIVQQALSAMGERCVATHVDMRYAEPEDLYLALLLALGEDADNPRPVKALHGVRQVMSRLGRQGHRLMLSLDTGRLTADLAKHLLRVANLAGEQDCQLNIVLMCPHSLYQQLDMPAVIQLRQRAAYRHRVQAMTLAETDRYIRHQIEAVGGDPAIMIDTTVAAAVYCYVAGVPRLINTLVDAALSHACIDKQEQLDGDRIKRTAENLGWKTLTLSRQSAAEAARPAQLRGVSAVRLPAAARSDMAPAVPTRSAPARAAGADTSQRRQSAAWHSEPALQLLVSENNGTRQDGESFSLGNLASPEPVRPAPDFREAPPPTQPAGISSGVAPQVAMQGIDPEATGMLRLEDLDQRLVETIFGTDLDEAVAALKKGRDAT
jgi:type II secretory pathway predicted ATPase ExeA